MNDTNDKSANYEHHEHSLNGVAFADHEDKILVIRHRQSAMLVSKHKLFKLISFAILNYKFKTLILNFQIKLPSPWSRSDRMSIIPC